MMRLHNNYHFIYNYSIKTLSLWFSMITTYILKQIFDNYVKIHPNFEYVNVCTRNLIVAVWTAASTFLAQTGRITNPTVTPEEVSRKTVEYLNMLTAMSDSGDLSVRILDGLFNLFVMTVSFTFYLVGASSLFTSFLNMRMAPIEGVPYTDIKCNIDIWQSCVSNNIYPGMNMIYVNEELLKCMMLCEHAAKVV